MARKKTAQFQNEYIVSFKLTEDDLQDSHTVIAASPSEAEQKFSAATGHNSSVIANILKTENFAII